MSAILLGSAEHGQAVWFNEFDNICHGIVGDKVEEDYSQETCRCITLDNGFITSKPLITKVYDTREDAKNALIETLEKLVEKTHEEIRMLGEVVSKYQYRIIELKDET